jgi:hypothetical protein
MGLSLGQIFFLVLIVCFLIFSIRTKKNLLSNRIIILAFTFGSIVLVTVPKISTIIANFIGIGRGVDLVIYLFIVFAMFNFIRQDSSMKELEHSLTEVARQHAIDHAVDNRKIN